MGKPKGVLVPHGGLVTMLESQIEAFQLSANSRSYWMHGTAFDASISDVGTVLLTGATLVMDRDIPFGDLVNRWSQLEISHVDLPPALLADLDADLAPKSLRTIVVGGQVCDVSAVRYWSKRCRVVNVYGPTEATVCTSWAICDPSWNKPDIGRPVPGITYSVDEMSGELSITGAGVALGYWRNPALTEQVFSTDQHGVRTYRTRDRVRRLPDGGFEFLGRLDRQLKIHGRLIHPEEIEQVLAPVKTHVLGLNGCLAICVEGDAGSRPFLEDQLKRALPEWMIPSLWRFVVEIERLPNGKPDEKNISLLFRMSAEPFVSATRTESKLAEAFAAATGFAPCDFEADSLGMIRFLAEAEKRGIVLTTEAISAHRSIKSLSAAVDSRRIPSERKSTREFIEAIQPEVRSPLGYDMPKIRSPKQILLTGASGFFGSAILKALRSVFPLATVHGLQRNDQGITGDLTKDQFGWTNARFVERSELFDTVIHAAADVSYAKDFSRLFETNVRGTGRVIDFVQSGRPKAFHFISSLAVFVDAEPLPEICLESDDLEATQAVFGGYAQSKWAAEKLVRASCGPGGASIIRPGLLVADSKTGCHPPHDWFHAFVDQNLAETDFDQAESCDFLPVDIAADRVARIVACSTPGTWHIAGDRPLTFAEIQGMEGRLTENEFASSIRPLQQRGGNSPFRIFKNTGTQFSMTSTNTLLQNH